MGNKNSGRGRPTRYEEIQVGKLAQKAVDWAIANWSKLKKCDRMRILLQLASKYAGEPSVDKSKHYYNVTLEGLIKNVHNHGNEPEGDRTRQVSLSRVAEMSNN